MKKLLLLLVAVGSCLFAAAQTKMMPVAEYQNTLIRGTLSGSLT